MRLAVTTPDLSLETIANLMTAGTLLGYRRYAIENQDWPALYPRSNPKIGVKGMVFFGTPNQRQAFYNIQSGMYDSKKAIVEIVLADGRRTPLEVDISVWNGPKSKLLPPDEAKWSPTSFLGNQFYENIAGPLQMEEARMAFDHVVRRTKTLDFLGQLARRFNSLDT